MLRVDVGQMHERARELVVSGALDVDRVPVIRQAIDESNARGEGVILNLRGLIGVDRAGCEALLDWSARGTRLLECPPFLRRWIREERDSRIREYS